ncbi:hypothetical protein BH23CHL2_BH23CHL2_28040 [soil metagenome]
MPRLSRSQAEARRKIEELAASGLPPIPLGDQIMTALSVALPNDGYRLFGVDPATLLINRLLAASENDGWARAEWLQDIYLTQHSLPYSEMMVLMRRNLSAVALQERQSESWGYPADVLGWLDPIAHRDGFHAICSPVGGVLVGCFASNGRWIALSQFYRRDPGRPFRRTDVEFLRLVAPLIGRLIGAALGRERAMVAGPVSDPGGTGVLIVERAGGLRFESTTGASWRERLAAHDGVESGALPAAVWSAIALARRDPAGAGRVQVPLPDDALRVEASPADADASSYAVIIQPELRPATPEIPLDWELTAQERRVVELVLCGYSNAQISTALSISENTVQTHLRHIFDKLDVRSRSQVAARYFQEAFRPGLIGVGDGPVSGKL